MTKQQQEPPLILNMSLTFTTQLDITDPEIVTYLMEVSKDKDRFKSILISSMTSEPKFQQPLAQPLSQPVAQPVAAPATSSKPKATRKRKAEGPAAREFTEADIPEFLDALLEDHITFVPDSDVDYVDVSMIRARFEKVLADRYQITRGAKSIISRLLKPKQINVLLTQKMEAKDAEFINTIKTKPNDLMWASHVGEDYAMADYLNENNEVTFKNVFLKVKFSDDGLRAIPCKPRGKKTQKASSSAVTQDPVVAEQEASTIFATPAPPQSVEVSDDEEEDEE